MKTFAIIAGLGAGALALTACGGKGDDALGDNVAHTYENKADALEAQGRELLGQAENLRDEADRKEEAIDDSDVDADALNAEQKAAFVNKI